METRDNVILRLKDEYPQYPETLIVSIVNKFVIPRLEDDPIPDISEELLYANAKEMLTGEIFE